MALQVDAQDNLDVGLRLCDLSSPFHRVRSSHIYENEHLYSLHVSDSRVQITHTQNMVASCCQHCPFIKFVLEVGVAELLPAPNFRQSENLEYLLKLLWYSK